MPIRPVAVPGIGVAMLLVSLAVSGCSGGTAQAAPGKSAPPSAGEVAYYRCLEKRGVLLEKRDDGQLRVDKDAFDEKVHTSAEAKCANLLPADDAAPPAQVPADFAAKLTRFSACARAHGYPAYPDPNPTTGEYDLTAAEKQTYSSAEFKRAMTEQCSEAADSPTTVVGAEAPNGL
ncbi:hypothetical protein ACIO3O_07475 [Streptomyces sp. NPDC087440]|uniref:hypothetical protein n=1 Tax=Streptomyces sp. NPDC087440 TaxID=3365790 RepID=UPI003813DAF9